MYGRRLENLAAPEAGSDAANRYFVEAGLSGKADLSGDVEFRSAYAEQLSSHTAYSANLSVMNVYGKFLNRGVRFMNTYNGKQSYLMPDGSAVATMAKVSASYQPLSAARSCTAVSANGAMLPNLNIKTVTRGEFADRVLNGGLLSDEIYQVSSDAIDAFGDRIVCLGDGEDAWDAATYGQLLSVKNEADRKADISGQIFAGEIAAPQISGTSVSAGTGGFTSVKLSVVNVYGRLRGSVRFVNSSASKSSMLIPDGSNVATMAQISAATSHLASLSSMNAVSGNAGFTFGTGGATMTFDPDGYVRLSGQDNGISFSGGTFNQFEDGSYMALDQGFDQIRINAFDPKLSVGLGTWVERRIKDLVGNANSQLEEIA
nr:MAG TPA: hypothetical protein [Caudoviricetes sp.]